MSERPPGVLVLVVGPSGVGKDTLISGARQALEGDKRFSFVRRLVTRPADIDLEDHISLDATEFERARQAGRFAMTWQAHGLDYALPIGVDTDLALGRVVIANISRHAVPEAVARYPLCRVIQISAEISLRAARLAGRGRESRDQIVARLAREGATLPADVTPVVIDNSSSVGIGVTAFVMALRRIAED
ncbi:phosphonate metabolism protein/1,5-bisphosphokinase (PRPP-forming) PhnN [Devosia sp. XK-2]|uniref:phosphonate metabolism protein/1,5-bisphosphokinase (PRPP-forming) PhnN n=1 Tax=Devosia sp. XK-2 TaxID=3126689 RepID=UPI0030CE0EDF